MIISKTAGISEIFSSIQGEGTHMGERHLFVRFERCNIHCEYCDEIDKAGEAFDIDSVVKRIVKLEEEAGPHHYVSLTGGEPLVYAPFLRMLCPQLRERKFKLYLETNGILDRALSEIIEWVDVIAMDMKPASVTKEKNYWEEHEKFLKAAKAKELFIKVILSKEIDTQEFMTCVKMLRTHAPSIPFILQPISLKDREGHDDRELLRLMAELQQMASYYLRDVRIIPRLHRILNIK
ncbi:MAG: hypothetical protein COV74_01395 [Candidatus Omnitrophica bacterium CG11_big_fil_rev_8_21_14_0_20_45_26]|uniref:7-carboxy-7-deazaguanine synthase n=1 Tax=Candidatus Abzuiibacterium crystallinum TaxID=1974748 RepID=A0A2H0LU60_9BACT|nr:MAG: hypothetical protein COV74_01395 [Candidatus Omnitrophica bacterium CG11_big_fil_rev_8_21_14_0_20_45_26]PIW64953.1 MAG: hypothetical protein COW12_03675 [Candidatus Omnitrophica bacterium CG12_big_fil_rev_8_21_14_0_65_45_16]